MLSRKYRATRENIEECIKKGSTIFSNFLYAKASKNDLTLPSFSIVVSKKVEKSSVGRHLIKRRISDALEVSLPKISPEFKKTLVIFAKNSKTTTPYLEIRKETENILKNSGFYG